MSNLAVGEALAVIATLSWGYTVIMVCDSGVDLMFISPSLCDVFAPLVRVFVSGSVFMRVWRLF